MSNIVGEENWIASEIPVNKWVTVVVGPAFLRTILVSNTSETEDAHIRLRLTDAYGKKDLFVLEPNVLIAKNNSERFDVNSLIVRGQADNPIENQKIQIMSTAVGVQALASGLKLSTTAP